MKTLDRVLLTCLAALLAAVSLATAQAAHAAESNRPEFDHTTVFVRDAAASAAFYEKVVRLERIPDPFKDATHVWFRAGAHEQLHVVGGAKESTSHEIDVHFAFRVASVEDFARHLDELGVKHHVMHGDARIQVRPDGVHQIYFQDPDGYWIEINDDKF